MSARLLAALPVLGVLAAPAAGQAQCSAALALGLDVSSSVDASEHRLQTTGLADAFRDPAIIDAILAGTGSGIMVAVYEWSGYFQQNVLIGWTWLGDREAIDAFADRIAGQTRQQDAWPTSLGRAVEFAAKLHAENPRECLRRVVDISGDGVNNHGVGPDWYRSRGHLEGLTVNGLAIKGAIPDPAAYYRKYLIHGPDAFVEVANSYQDYPQAIRRKLLRELVAPAVATR